MPKISGHSPNNNTGSLVFKCGLILVSQYGLNMGHAISWEVICSLDMLGIILALEFMFKEYMEYSPSILHSHSTYLYIAVCRVSSIV